MTSHSLPEISIIVPVYNSEKYLKSCIESLIHQTFGEIEIICVDDCSEDNSREILSEMLPLDDRIVIRLLDKNMGAGYCRNEGIGLATGKYLCFVDADDCAEEQMCETLLKKAKESKADIVLGATRCFANSGVVMQNPEILLDAFVKNCPDLDDIKMIPDLLFTRLTPWAKLIKKSLVEKNKVKFQNSRVGNDVRFSIELYLLAKKISAVDQIVYGYRTDVKESTSKKTTRCRFDIFRVWDEADRILNKYGMGYEYKEAYLKHQQRSLIYSHFPHLKKGLQKEFYQIMRNRFSDFPRKSLGFYGRLVVCCNFFMFRGCWFLGGFWRRYIYIKRRRMLR